MNQGRHFINLCEEDWRRHYNLLPDGKLEILTLAADYTIEIIGLNGAGYIDIRKKILDMGGFIFQGR